MIWEASLFGSVLARLPSAVRERAAQATFMRASGYNEAEIAAALTVNRRTLHRDRQALRRAFIDALREDGFTDREIARDYDLAVDEIPCPNS